MTGPRRCGGRAGRGGGKDGFHLFSFRAFLWSDGQTIALDAGTPGGTGSVAGGINNAGQAVGAVWTADNLNRPVLWTDGTTLDLGTLGGEAGLATAINDAGQARTTLREPAILGSWIDERARTRRRPQR